MKNFVRYLIFSIIVSNCTNTYPQNDILKNLNNQGWQRVDSMFYGSRTWHCANYSDIEWKVYLNGIELNVIEISNKDSTFYRLENGYLRGTDRGEWIGELSYYSLSDEGKVNRQEIKRGNFIAIFNYNNSIYALEGISHLGVSNGLLTKIFEKDGNWTYKTVCNLKDKPFAYTIDSSNNLYVVTYKKLIRIKGEKIKETIIDNAFWKSLYPSSIVIIGENALIGMRGVIGLVDLKNKTATTLSKK